MDSEKSAESAALTKNKKLMFVGGVRRYVEVIQCSGDEMAMVLQQGLPAPLPTVPLSSLPQVSTAGAGVLPAGFWSLPPPPTLPNTDLAVLLQQHSAAVQLPAVQGSFTVCRPTLCVRAAFVMVKGYVVICVK